MVWNFYFSSGERVSAFSWGLEGSDEKWVKDCAWGRKGVLVLRGVGWDSMVGGKGGGLGDVVLWKMRFWIRWIR